MKFYKFPTAVKKLVGVEAVNGIDFNGFKWKVGEISQGVEFIYDIDDLMTYYPLFVKHLQEQGEDISKMVVSLPLETFLESFELKKAGQENLIDKLSSDIISKIEDCKQCIVLPQGSSALYKIKKETDDITGNILVIDGGFNTVNIAIANFTSASNINILFSHTIFDEFGVRDLLEKFFRKELALKYNNVTSNLQVLNSTFNQGKIDSGFNTIDVTNEKKRAIKIFTESLIDRIQKIVSKAKIQYDSIVVVGGLSYYIDFDTNKSKFIPQKDGEFYTLMGMLEKVSDGFLALDLGFGDAKVGKK